MLTHTSVTALVMPGTQGGVHPLAVHWGAPGGVLCALAGTNHLCVRNSTAYRPMKMHVPPLALLPLPHSCFFKPLCRRHTVAVEPLMQPHVTDDCRVRAEHTDMGRAEGRVGGRWMLAPVKEELVEE